MSSSAATASAASRPKGAANLGDRAQSRAADQREAAIVALVTQLRLARVDGHAYADYGAVRPGLGRERALCVERRGDRVPGSREGG